MIMAATISEALGGFGAAPDPEAMPEVALARAVRHGLPFAALQRLIVEGMVSEHEVQANFIPRRTFFARKSKGTLSREQGDLVVRLLRIQSIADEVFGSRAKAQRWLRKPNGAMEGQVPLELLDTNEGSRLVEMILGRIAHGIVE